MDSESELKLKTGGTRDEDRMETEGSSADSYQDTSECSNVQSLSSPNNMEKECLQDLAHGNQNVRDSPNETNTAPVEDPINQNAETILPGSSNNRTGEIATAKSTGESISTLSPRNSIEESIKAASPRNSTEESLTTSSPRNSIEESITSSSPRNSIGESIKFASQRNSIEESIKAASPRNSTEESLTTSSPRNSIEKSITTSSPRNSIGESIKVASPRSSIGESIKFASPRSSIGESIKFASPRSSIADIDKIESPTNSTGESIATASPRNSIGESITAANPRNSIEESITTSSPRNSIGESITTSSPRNSIGESIPAANPRNSIGESVKFASPRSSTVGAETTQSPTNSTGESVATASPRNSTGESLTTSSPRNSIGESITTSSPRNGIEESINFTSPKNSIGEFITTLSPRNSIDESIKTSSPRNSIGKSIKTASPGNSKVESDNLESSINNSSKLTKTESPRNSIVETNFTKNLRDSSGEMYATESSRNSIGETDKTEKPRRSDSIGEETTPENPRNSIGKTAKMECPNDEPGETETLISAFPVCYNINNEGNDEETSLGDSPSKSSQSDDLIECLISNGQESPENGSPDNQVILTDLGKIGGPSDDSKNTDIHETDLNRDGTNYIPRGIRQSTSGACDETQRMFDIETNDDIEDKTSSNQDNSNLNSNREGSGMTSAFGINDKAHNTSPTEEFVNKRSGVVVLNLLPDDLINVRLSQLSDISEETDVQLEGGSNPGETYQVLESDVILDAPVEKPCALGSVTDSAGDRPSAKCLDSGEDVTNNTMSSNAGEIPYREKGDISPDPCSGHISTKAVIEKSDDVHPEPLDESETVSRVGMDGSPEECSADEDRGLLVPKAECDSIDLIDDDDTPSQQDPLPDPKGPQPDPKASPGVRKVADAFIHNRYQNMSKRRRVYTTVIKYVLFFFNFICWVAGVSAAGPAVWMLMEKHKTVRDALDFFLDPAIILCIGGVIIFVVAFFGFVGALRENILLLKIWHISLSVFLVAELIFGALVFIFYFFPGISRDLNLAPEDWGLKEAIKKYKDDKGMRDWIDMVQKEMKCCGVTNSDEGYRDWQANPYYNCSERNPSPHRCAVPPSCCIIEPGDYYNTLCGYDTNDKEVWEVERDIYTQGCVQGFGKWLRRNAVFIGAAFTGVVVPQFIGIVMARVYIKLTTTKQVQSRWKTLKLRSLSRITGEAAATEGTDV